MNEGQELVEAPSTEIQVFSEFDARIAELKEHLTNKEYNLTTKEGKDEAEKDKGELRGVEIKIEKKRKVKGAGLLKATKSLNADAKVYHNKVHGLWEIIDKPLQIIRQAELDAAMDKRDAEIAAEKAIQDAKDAELEKLRKIVADQEAKDNATNIEAEAKQREEQAAIRAVAQAEQKQQAEQNRIAKVNRKRIANQEHRREFNNLAVAELNKLTQNKAISKSIVEAIVKNEITNVTLNY